MPGAPVDERGRLRVGRNLAIPLDELEWRTTTSGGPGGQHANRSSTRVEVRFHVEASPSLGPRQRARLRAKLGEVVRASAGESRSQARNRDAALLRLANRLEDALRVRPARIATRPSTAASARRVEEKRRHGARKRERAVASDD